MGTTLMEAICKEYEDFNRCILTTELDKEAFYHKFAFENTEIAMIKKQWNKVD